MKICRTILCSLLTKFLGLQVGKWKAWLITLHNVFTVDDCKVSFFGWGRGGVSAYMAEFVIWPAAVIAK